MCVQAEAAAPLPCSGEVTTAGDRNATGMLSVLEGDGNI